MFSMGHLVMNDGGSIFLRSVTQGTFIQFM